MIEHCGIIYQITQGGANMSNKESKIPNIQLADQARFISAVKDSTDFITLISEDDLMRIRFTIIFANFVNKQRQALGWTQEELAEKSRVNRITISKIERYHQTASIEVILKILKAFNMTIQFVSADGKT